MISRAAAIEHVIGPLDMFEPHPENPRVMDATARRALAASVDRFGLVQPIVANRRTGRVVGGHQRLEMLRERGEVETEWWVGDWSEAEERALMVQLNDPASQGAWDQDRLASVVASVRAELPEIVRELAIERHAPPPRVAPSSDDAPRAETSGGVEAGLVAPFPWFGGKRRVAAEVWRRLGDVAVYAEPFAGSLAVLLGRPPDHVGSIETVNDLDSFVANAWRAILRDPAATAHAADWPSNENDLHARHAWLVSQRADLTARLEGDPEFFDAKIAGWWLWGVSCWIGSGWCSGAGPWRVEDGKLVKEGGDAGRGVTRKLVHLGCAGRGVSRQLVHLSGAGAGDPDRDGTGENGLVAWLRALAARLCRVRVCSGDWARILTPSALAGSVSGVRGIFLDPPYDLGERDPNCYAVDAPNIARDVRRWCATAPSDYRIALCGYAGEGHESLVSDLGWTEVAWSAQGGMSRDRGEGSGGNNDRERIWFSPACLSP